MRNRRLGIIVFEILWIKRLVVDGRVRKQDLQIVGWLIESNQYPGSGPQLCLGELVDDGVKHFSFCHGFRHFTVQTSFESSLSLASFARASASEENFTRTLNVAPARSTNVDMKP